MYNDYTNDYTNYPLPINCSERIENVPDIRRNIKEAMQVGIFVVLTFYR